MSRRRGPGRVLLLAAVAALPMCAQTPIGNLIAGQSRTGFTVEGAGARALGMGGAFIAVADDATAATFNPAGLAQLLKPEISFVGQGLQRQISYQQFETTTRGKQLAVSDSLVGHTHFDPLLLSAMIPLRVAGRNLAVQVSVQRAYTLGEGDSVNVVETPVTGSGAPVNLTQSLWQSGQIDLYSLSLAYECSQRILLGLTFNQWRGRWDLDTSSVQSTGSAVSSARFRQSNRLDGQNYTMGLLWRWPTWSLGLVHQTGFRADYSYTTRIDTTLPVTVPLNSSEPHVGLHWPDSSGLGLAYRPGEYWLVTGDLQVTPWSEAKFMTGDTSLNGVGFFDPTRNGQGQNATVLRLGMERLWVTRNGLLVPFRLGASREPQPLVDPVTGEQRIMYGLATGSGFKRGRYTVDLAYRYAWAKRRTSQFLDVQQLLAGTHTSSVGTERTVEQRVELTCIMQFDRQPVDRVLHHLFVGD
jgi:long-subunit fatty acid transport protein